MIESELLKYEPYYLQINDKNSIEYTESEIDDLKNLPKKTFLLDKEQKFYAYIGLVDILFAYCYNDRVNCGEKNVESGWTISKLSSTLSWFDVK
jgi:protein SHQ1